MIWAVRLGDATGESLGAKGLGLFYFFHADDWGETAQHGACNVVALWLKFIRETFPELGLCSQPAQFGFWRVPF